MKKEKWKDHEIKQAAKIYHKAHQQRSKAIIILEYSIGWLLLLLIISGSILLSAFLILLSSIIETELLYSLAVLLGLGLGMLIELPIHEIRKIDKSKHKVIRSTIPFLALANIAFIVYLKKSIETISGFKFLFDPLYLGISYGIGLIVPSIFVLMRKRVAGETLKS